MKNKKLALSVLVSSLMLPSLSFAQTGGAMEQLAREAGELNVPAPAAVPAAEPIKAVPQQFAAGESTSYSGTAVTVWHAISQQVGDLMPTTDAPSFEAISDRVMKASKSSAHPARMAGQPSLFTDPGFVSEFEQVTGGRFSDGNYARFLINGEASFAAKDSLIQNAQKSLLVSSWAFYDDTTGYEAAQMLIAKKKQGVDVKVMVDNIVEASHGFKVVKMMQQAGIEVVLHKDPERYSDIWHVKTMIVDDKYAITGGMNFGDVYSHKGSGSIKWRDTDVIYSGPAVMDAKRLLGNEWNSQVTSRKLGFGLVDVNRSAADSYQGGAARVAVVLENPPKYSPILTSIVKAMYGATKTINIENAYFVALPVVTQAVMDARARGVEVNLLTNSKESIDSEGKPIVDAMAECLIPLYQAGVKIYLKQGVEQTLHSKFMTVDGEFADIGSYNLHPRGERSDSEMNVNILGREAVAQLDGAFAKDIAAAKQITSLKDLETKPGFISYVMSHYFYAQLSAPIPGAETLVPGK
jgi:cardiolipin synthase